MTHQQTNDAPRAIRLRPQFAAATPKSNPASDPPYPQLNSQPARRQNRSAALQRLEKSRGLRAMPRGAPIGQSVFEQQLEYRCPGDQEKPLSAAAPMPGNWT